MQIDALSYDFVKIALYLDSKKPGSVSEVWLDEGILTKLKSELGSTDISQLINDLRSQISELTDKRRRKYLTGQLDSLEYQLTEDYEHESLEKFSTICFGYEIKPVSRGRLNEINSQIGLIEKTLGKTRHELLAEDTVTGAKILNTFSKYMTEAKHKLAEKLPMPDSEEFTLSGENDKPWGAFNYHLKPYFSKLVLNLDLDFTNYVLRELSTHEAYGGHHSELSIKDSLLVEENRGEHGLVIVFSPQVFISESIAEAASAIWSFNENPDLKTQLFTLYRTYTFALYNYIAFRYFDEKVSKNDLMAELKLFDLTESSRNEIINFATDELFGRYAIVYYSAKEFLLDLYAKVENKDEFLKDLYSLPCTAEILADSIKK